MTLESTLRNLLAQRECEWIELERNDAEPERGSIPQRRRQLCGPARHA